MDKRIAVPLLLASCAAPSYAYDYTDTAEVVAAVPIYETVNEPRQQCWTESVTYYEQSGRSNGGAIIGGITGGLLGAQVGKGNGRIAAAATAAAIGALVGDRLDNRYNFSSPVTRPVQRCNVVDNYRKTSAVIRLRTSTMAETRRWSCPTIRVPACASASASLTTAARTLTSCRSRKWSAPR